MGGWRVRRLVTGVVVTGALASGCAIGPAADRAEQVARSVAPSGQESPDGEGGTGTEEPPLPGGEPTEEPPPGPTPAPATGGASETGTSLAGLASACCVAELPESEDLLVGSGDTVLLRPADGGELTELGQVPGELLGLAVPTSATGRYIGVFAYYAGPGGGEVTGYRFYPGQEDPWGATPVSLLDTPVPLSGDGGGTLAFGPDGELYLGTGDGRILLLDPNGSDPPVEHSPGPYADLRGLAWDEDRMWAVDAGADGTARLYSVTPGGPPIEVELPGVGAVDPAGLAASEGSLWMPDAAGGQLWRIPLNGSNALVADPAPVLDLSEPRAVFTARGSTDLWALAGDSLRRLQVD